MFEAEREKCYAGIKKCDEFLKDYGVMFHGKAATVDKVPPKPALCDFKNRYKEGAVIFHLKVKDVFIRRLAEMQEAENIAEYAKSERG